MTKIVKGCADAVIRLDDHAVAALDHYLSKHENPTIAQQIAAVKDVLSDIKAERRSILAAVKKAHPQATEAKKPDVVEPVATENPQHIEAGKVEEVTGEVIRESITKSADKTPFNLKEATAWITKAVDAAVAKAGTEITPEVDDLIGRAQSLRSSIISLKGRLNPTDSALKTLAADKEALDRVIKQLDDQNAYVVFDVPGDGKFKVLNTKEKLTKFKANVLKAMAYKGDGPLRETVSQNGPQTTLKDMIGEDDMQGAYHFAMLHGGVKFGLGKDAQIAYGMVEDVSIEGIDTFVGMSFEEGRGKKDGKKKWLVIEPVTGQSIGDGAETKSKAIDAAKAKIKTAEAKGQKVKEKIADLIKEAEAKGVSSQEERLQAWAKKESVDLGEENQEQLSASPVAESRANAPEALADEVATVQDGAGPDTKKQDRKAIQDFGEEISGAKKMLYTEAYTDSMSDAKNLDIAAHPLSKTWPEPDYQKLLDGGSNKWAVAFAHAARDSVPTKPQKGWKLKGWAEKVEVLRSFTEEMLNPDTLKGERAKALFESAPYRVLREELGGKVDLYMAVGHENSLKGISLRSGSYSMYAGIKYDPMKTLWAVNQKGGAAFGNWGKDLAVGESKQEAIEKFKEYLAGNSESSKPAAKGTSFELYSKRGAKENPIFIGKKINKVVAELKTGFPDVKSARAYLAENKDELEDLLSKYKHIPSERNTENAPRVGADHRKNSDVTPEQFHEAFGFRGVQFGNYVEGSRRQQDLNKAYDALMDLAGVLNIPPKALSLDGKLALAFGARGSGGINAFAAHYEPGQVVINLTKSNGAGSLAHEWWHALDNYFAKNGGGLSPYMTESTQGGTGVREEMRKAFDDVKKTIALTGIKQRSRELDNKKSKDYWTTGREMSARSFESYIIAKLQDQSASNDYLANIVNEALYALQGAYPYPTAGEMPQIRAAFDNFFHTVETKDSGEGKVALFRKGDTNSGIPREEAEKVVADFIADYKGTQKLGYAIYDTKEQAYGTDNLKRMNLQDQVLKGGYKDGKVHVILDGHKDASDLLDTLRHETWTHYGFDLVQPLRKAKILKDLKADIDANGALKSIYERVSRSYRDDKGNLPSEQVLVEETVARIAEIYGDRIHDRAMESGLKSAVRKILDYVAAVLRSIGLMQKEDGIEQALKFLVQSARTQRSKLSTSLAANTGIALASQKGSGNWYYSALKEAAADMLQNKGTPEQMLAMLARQKGVKPAEIEATGLKEYLELQGKSVTKQQIVDYLVGNGVQVTETMLGAGKEPKLPDGWTVKYEREQDAWVVYDEDGEEVADGTSRADAIEMAMDDEERADNPDSVGGTKFGQYVLPGGKNYRELLLTLPQKSTETKRSGRYYFDNNDEVDYFLSSLEKIDGPAYRQNRSAFSSLLKDGGLQFAFSSDAPEWFINESHKLAAELVAKTEYDSVQKADFNSSHYGQPNILAHVRFNERTDADGKRVLFLEELQSDFQQSYRKAKKQVAEAVDADFLGIVERMKRAGVLEVNCD